jgi:thymidylate synthase
MTATNLVNKFEYKPLYKPNQLICGTGQTAIVSGWTVKSAIAKHLPSQEYGAMVNCTKTKRGTEPLNFISFWQKCPHSLVMCSSSFF